MTSVTTLKDIVRKSIEENVDLDMASTCFTLGYAAGESYLVNRKNTYCVTGGSGFLGSWCVKMLLDKGHVVHCTTRSPGKAEYLKKICGDAGDRLKIFSGCDLLKPGSFDAAVKGCACVLHTASPFFVWGGSVENLIKPAVEGTKNVLDTCSRMKVKRVVLTSSTAAVYANYDLHDESHVYTEDDWSPEDRMIAAKNFYCLSKTKAEKLAWDYAKSKASTFQLAVMNPTLIWGPMLSGQPHFNTSCAALVGFMDGSKKEIPNGTKAVVDVRDVAEAHVIAAEDESCALPCWGKRMLLISDSPKWSVVVSHMKKVLPADLAKNVPSEISKTLDKTTLGAPHPWPTLFDGTRAESHLNRKLRSTEVMVQSCVTSMIKNGFVKSESYIPGK